jgi:amino-acid N-acetyltransferase
MAHLKEGHLLPRELHELRTHAERFIVAVEEDGSIVACGELAPLSHTLGEVRSFVVSRQHRGLGLGRRMIEEIRRRARVRGFEALCAFTHQPAYFARLDFSIVPHTWLPEKISADCSVCPLFRRCGQYAMLVEVEPAPRARSALTALHA